MFKNFLIMSLTAIMSGSGCLPFLPLTQKENSNQEKYVSQDGIHPSNEGYKYYVNILNEIIEY